MTGEKLLVNEIQIKFHLKKLQGCLQLQYDQSK